MLRVLLFIHIALVLISCGNTGNVDEHKVFRYNESNNITSLDPAFARDQSSIWAVSQLFNGLVQLDKDLNVKPCIANSWEISDSGLTYTFHLRQDVSFHEHGLLKSSGRIVKASDFVYSFNRIISPKTASPGAWIFNDKITEDTPPFVAVDDTTFVIHLRKQSPVLLGLLTMPYCYVVPKEMVEYYGADFRTHPIGTGPFIFKHWEEGVKLALLKNQAYFETDDQGNDLPYLDAVGISFIESKQTEFMEFVQGKLDFFTGLEGSYKDELLTKSGTLRKKYQDKFKLEVSPFLNTEYLAILVNPDSAIVQGSSLRHKQVRQAINYAIDREKMMKYLRNNIGRPAHQGFVPEGLPGFSTELKGYTYNPQKAKDLLTEAGYPQGKGLEEITIYTSKDYLDLCVLIQNQLRAVGMKCKIEVNPAGFIKEQKSKYKLNIFRASWIADYPDAENYLALFYSNNFSPQGPNYTHYHNAAFDALYERSLKETNDTLRYRMNRQMDSLIIADAPVVPLFYDQSIRLVQNNITGLENNAMNRLELKRVKKGRSSSK